MCRVMRCIHHEPQNLMIIDDNDNSFPIAIRNRYEILRRMFVLEGRAIIGPSSLLAASRVLIRS